MGIEYRKVFITLIVSAGIAIASMGCGGEESCTVIENDNGTKTISCADGTETTVAEADEGAPIVDVSEEEPGENCEAGGTRVDIGDDQNGDGELSDDEIEQTQYNCDNSSTLVEVEEVDASEECPIGGHRVIAGEDINDDGELSEDEIDSESLVCKSCSPDPETPSVIYDGECLPDSAAFTIEGTIDTVEDSSGLLRDSDFAEGDTCSADVVYRLDLGDSELEQEDIAYYAHTSQPYGIYATFGSDSVETVATQGPDPQEDTFVLGLGSSDNSSRADNGIAAVSNYNSSLYGLTTESVTLFLIDENGEALSSVEAPTELPEFDAFTDTFMQIELIDDNSGDEVTATCELESLEFL